MSDRDKTYIDTRSPQQIEVDKVQVERERFDLDNWKKRAPAEIICTKLSYVIDEQTMFRRNIETLTSLRKTFIADTKNADLQTAVDAKITEFVQALTVTKVTVNLIEELLTSNSETE